MNIDAGSMRAQQKSNTGNVQIKQSQATQERLAQADAQAAKESEAANDTGKGVKVSISMAGKQKLTDEVNGTEKKEKGSPADLAIAKLKEQIERVKEQLEALQGDNSPEAKEQRKMLQQQLGMLNAALLSAMDKKLKAEQKNS